MSEFYSDGYRDAENGLPPSPPDAFNGSNVLAAEYMDGYRAAQIAESVASNPVAAG